MPVRISRVLVVGGWVAASAAVAMTSPLTPTYSYTVTAGSAATGVPFSLHGESTGTTPEITFVDTTEHRTIAGCDSGTMHGAGVTGKDRSGDGVVSVDGRATTFTNCRGPSRPDFDITGIGVWSLDATEPISDGIYIRLNGIRLNFSAGPSCNFTVSGSLRGRYNNSYWMLVSDVAAGSLTIDNVAAQQCSGIVANGDEASFAVAYKVRSDTLAQNPVTITGS